MFLSGFVSCYFLSKALYATQFKKANLTTDNFHGSKAQYTT